jgi:tetratricopeptide (TPR) repeat protein
MNPRLNPAVVALLVVAVSACGGPEERKEQYRLRAQEYMQEGNFPKARVALRNVLKIDPKDPEAYYLFAQVEERERNWRNAFANYMRAVELAPRHERAQLRLAKFYLEARMVEKVSEITEGVLALHPDNVQARSLQIAVTAVNGKVDEAIARGEALVAGHPHDPDAALLLASLYLTQGRGADAETVLRRTADANPTDLEVLDGLASVLAKVGRVGQAEALYRKLVQLEPNEFEHRVKLAKFYDRQQESGKAEAVLRDAVKLDPDQEVRHLALAEYLVQRGLSGQVEAVLLEARRRLPYATKLSFALAALYENQGAPEKARAVYEAVRNDNKRDPVALEARVKLASLDWAAGREAEAERQLQQVLRENPRSLEGLMLQGRIALKRNDGKDAVRAFRSVVKDQPESVTAHLLLGQAYLQTGETGLARESFDRATVLNPGMSEAQVLLAGLDAADGHVAEAKQRLEAVVVREPNNLNALGALFRLQLAGREWTGTEETLDRLRKAGLGTAAAGMTEGNLHLARQDWDKAAAAFERALAAAPDAPEPLLALIRLDQARGRLATAMMRLERVLANASHPYAHGFMGELLMQRGDLAGAAEQFLAATKVNPKWSVPWLHLATLRMAEKRASDSQKILMEGLSANPQSEELRLLLAISLTDSGRVDEAIGEYETVLKQSPRNLLAANNLASLLVDRKGDRQSLERALTLSRDFERQAPNPYFLDTLGWVHLKLGHPDEAVRVMRMAVEKAPAHPVLNYHLGAAYAQSGRSNDAKAYLQKALSAGQSFAGIDDARVLLAGLNG